ncbi:MAG: DUF6483 family protein [Eubacteriaceae bacterium]
MFQNDFLMKEIEDFAKFVARILKKEKRKMVGEETRAYTQEDYYLDRFQKLIYEGKINQGENELFELIEDKPTLERLKLAENFYTEISKMSDAFLEKNDYSRDEMFESINQIKKIYEK